jgi:hypothetical protein
MGEQALNALVLSSKDKKDLPTLFDAGAKLVQKFPNTENAKQTMGILINTSIKIGQYRLLAQYLEQFAQRYPGDSNASNFLLQAAHIHEGLGNYADANNDYSRVLKSGKANRSQIEEIAFAYADNAQKMGRTESAIQVLNASMNNLSSDARLRARALMGVLNLKMNRRSTAFKLSRQVTKAYRPAMGQNDPLLLDYVAQLAYSELYHSSGQYYDLKLKGNIDNAIVAKKAQMLEQLEQGYQKVMNYKSPTWALKACFRANELNREFASFLINSPAPAELGPQERQQYRELIRQKAQAYNDKADQYLKTTIEMARKWQVCDPELAGFFTPADNPTGREEGFRSVSERRASAQVGRFALQDATIGALYQQLLAQPDDTTTQLALARAYIKQGDFNQAALIAKNTLSKNDGGSSTIKAEMLNILGLAYLNEGNDPLAKESFEQAMAADRHAKAPRINLAGIYRHYGHLDKAAELMRATSPSDLQQEGVHPRIGATSNAYSMQTK